MLNLAWDEPADQMVVADDIYGNDGDNGAALPGAGRRDVTAADIGKRVTVQGYRCSGILRFFGPHHERGASRCGVEDKPLGKNDGIVGVRWRGKGEKLAAVLNRPLPFSHAGCLVSCRATFTFSASLGMAC